MVAEKSVTCGKTYSNDQLMNSSLSEIDNILNEQTGSTKNNQLVPPGKVIPFTIVFKNVPQGAGEFGVEAVVPTAAER